MERPCRNADFISKELIFQFFVTTNDKISIKFSLQQVGESSLISSFSISSKPLTTKQAL